MFMSIIKNGGAYWKGALINKNSFERGRLYGTQFRVSDEINPFRQSTSASHYYDI